MTRPTNLKKARWLSYWKLYWFGWKETPLLCSEKRQWLGLNISWLSFTKKSRETPPASMPASSLNWISMGARISRAVYAFNCAYVSMKIDSRSTRRRNRRWYPPSFLRF